MDFSRFLELFDGSKRKYGIFKPSGLKRSDGKVEGEYNWKEFPVDGNELPIFTDHIEGKTPIGIVPTRPDGSCSYGCIDVDKIKSVDEANEVLAKIKSWNLPFIPFKSKSGGIHAYLFVDGSVSAKELKTRLRTLSLKLGRPKKTIDIFPVQTRLSEDGTGNMLNVPYFNAKDTGPERRWAIKDYDMNDLYTLEEFLQMPIKKITPEELFKIGNKFTSDYPPCMDYYFENNVGEGERDKVLMQFGCVARKIHGDDQEKVNNDMYEFVEKHFQSKDGFTPKEFSTKVSQVMRKKDVVDQKDEEDIWLYKNNCRQIDELGHCDRVGCRTRKYGLVEKIVMVTDYRMLKTMPRRHLLTMVNEQGDEIVVSMTTDQLWTQNTIAKRCWEENIQWTMLPSEEFQTMKDNWFTQMKIVDSYDEGEEKMSEFFSILTAFIDERRGGNDISQIEMGYVWKDDKENGRYFWNVTSFKNYAKQKYNKAYETSLGEILAKLCEKEKNKYPDKKDACKRFIQLHKTYQEYKGRCYSTLQTFKVIPRDNSENIESFKKEMKSNEFTAN